MVARSFAVLDLGIAERRAVDCWSTAAVKSTWFSLILWMHLMCWQ